jgi:outer membrane protein, heavy metal efflux system
MNKINKKYAILLCLSWFSMIHSLSAQMGIQSILSEIEKNNPTLSVLKSTVESHKNENNLGKVLSDPEVNLDYLWGSPKPVGNRLEWSIQQAFDVPTLFGMKGRLSEAKNEALDFWYKNQRIQVLLEAKKCCLEMVSFNAMLRVRKEMFEKSKMLFEAYQSKLDEGVSTQMELNNIQLSMASMEGALKALEVERQACLNKLMMLNGGAPVVVEADEFPMYKLMSDFETWYEMVIQKHPLIAYINQEVEVGKKQLSVDKAQNLPTISAGYISETVIGAQSRGVTMGVSFPVWDNKNRLKKSRSDLKLAELRRQESLNQLRGELKMMFDKTLGLQSVAATYRFSIKQNNQLELIQKALSAGEISLLEYIEENMLYCNAVDMALQAEREFQLSLAELNSMNL